MGPITLLPLEILTHVFLSCIQDEDDHSPDVPLILGQVCSSWRKLVLKLPQLWTHLSINLTARTSLPAASPFTSSSSSSQQPRLSKSPEALANLANLWFERAKNQLLSVTINLTAMNATAVQDVSSSLVRPILSHAKSIQHLSIHASSHTQLANLFSRSDVEFTNLESLSLSLQHAASSSSSSPITTFTNAPRLTQVFFDLNGSPPSTSLIHLPWAQLEQFSMSGASLLPADECRLLLSTCTNLRKASVWIDDDYTQSDEKTPTTLLPHLTHLSLSFYGRHEKTINSLLTSFDLPHLRHLHFFSGFITLPFIPPVTSRHLETVSLSGVDVSAAQLENLALVASSLCSLALDLRYCSGEIPAIASVLATDSSSPLVFPYLSKLSIWTRHISPNSASYAQLIRSRSRNPNHTPFCLDVYLARQRHGICSSSCCSKMTLSSSSSVGSSQFDNILSLFDVCDKATGVVLRIMDVRPDEGISETSFF